MKGFARFVSRVFAYLLLLIFLFALPASLLMFNAGRVIFAREQLTALLHDSFTQTNLVSAALAWYSEEISKSLPVQNEVALDIAVVFASLDQEAWLAIQREILPDDIVAGWSASLVNDFHAWLDSQEAAPRFHLDLASFKARINSNHGFRTMEIAYNILPVCLPEQIAEFETKLQTSLAEGDVYYPPCEFPAPLREEQLTAYLNNTRQIVDNIPDEITFPAPSGEPQTEGGNTLRLIMRFLRTFYWFVPLLPVLLLALISGMVIRSPRDFARWWGVAFSIGGLLTIITAWLARVTLSGYLMNNVFRNLPEEVAAEFRQVLGMLFHQMFSPMMAQGFVIVILGGAILVIIGGMMGRAQLVSKRERTQAAS